MFNRRSFIEAAAGVGTAIGLEAAAIGLLLSSGADAQDSQSIGHLSAAERLNQQGPEARRIAARTGLWDLTETQWDASGENPKAMTGLVAERRMMGSLLQEIVRPPADTALKAVARTDLLAFHRVEGRWGYVSFDTRAPVGLMMAWSADGGDGDSIELAFAPFATASAGAEVGGTLLRMSQVIHFESADRDVKDQYFTAADGTGQKRLLHRYTYERRQ